MKFNSQICTTRVQSERLLALGLKKETADMHYPTISEDEHTIRACWEDFWDSRKAIDGYIRRRCIPAWSLHRLIEMIPITVPDKSGITHFFTIDGAGDISYYYFGEESWENWKSWYQKELYDNVIDCFEWLIKEGHFNTEYLEE